MSMIFNILRVSSSELNEYLKDSSLLETRIYEDETSEAKLVDLDKAWEGILFLLTGSNLENLDHPMGRALFSGQLIDEEQDLGYGPGNYLTAEQVKEFNSKLAAISAEELKTRFNPGKMMEIGIYPEIWDEEGVYEYLEENLIQLKNAFAEAAKNNEAVITFLN